MTTDIENLPLEDLDVLYANASNAVDDARNYLKRIAKARENAQQREEMKSKVDKTNPNERDALLQALIARSVDTGSSVGTPGN